MISKIKEHDREINKLKEAEYKIMEVSQSVE